MISALIFTGLLLPMQALPEGITTSIGFGASPVYGNGYTFKDESGFWGMQVVALPYRTNDSSFLAAGGTGFFVLNKEKFIKLFISFDVGAYTKSTTIYNNVIINKSCNGIWHHANEVCSYLRPDPDGKKIITGGFGVGAGVGAEIEIYPNLTFSMEMPLAAIFEINDGINLKSIVPIPNGALSYNF